MSVPVKKLNFFMMHISILVKRLCRCYILDFKHGATLTLYALFSTCEERSKILCTMVKVAQDFNSRTAKNLNFFAFIDRP